MEVASVSTSCYEYPQFQSKEERLKSFAMWPRFLRIRPESLCEAGFFYTGCGDRVICHSCGGGLKDWGTDDPWEEHAFAYQNCTYLIDMKGQEFVDKLQQEKESNQRKKQQQQNLLKLEHATGAPLLEIK